MPLHQHQDIPAEDLSLDEQDSSIDEQEPSSVMPLNRHKDISANDFSSVEQQPSSPKLASSSLSIAMTEEQQHDDRALYSLANELGRVQLVDAVTTSSSANPWPASSEVTLVFDDPSTADCILRNGEERHFVHTLVLSIRSPVFADLFARMREGGAWDSPDMDQDASGSESEDKEEVTNNGHGYEDNQGDSQLVMDTDEDNRTIGPSNDADDAVGLSNGITADVLDPQDLDYSDSMDDSGDDDLEANQEYDTHRPVLSVMNAETGTHFKELLKWMYHGDGQRWLRCFTPQNYTGILHNIDRFNLCALPEVMHVCLAFEASTPPELNLQGLALRMWERLFSHTTEANVIYVPDPDEQQHHHYHQEEEEELEEEEEEEHEEKFGQARVH